ncbi:MAG: universal stress protein [Schleiferiaceae bacterium]|nr:universal stress protein [Schleiferiaceae bacterium]
MSTESKKILVPIGFSEQSLKALEHAVIFAKEMKARIILLTVIEETGFWKRVFSAKTDRDEDSYRDEVHEKLKAVANEMSEQTGLEFDTMVAKGVPYEEISELSESLGVDLIVMGTNGKPSNMRKKFIGSNAYRVVTMSEPPVITIKGTKEVNKVDKIIFPLVLDRQSKQKAPPAVHYAKLFNASVMVVGVSRDKEEAQKLQPHVNQVVKFIKEKGVNCSSEIIRDNGKSRVESFLQYAYENDGDLVMIVEEEDEPDMAQRIMGNEVQKMIYLSDIPVMSVTPTPAKYQSMFANW